MADEVIDFDGLSISFDNKSNCNGDTYVLNRESRRFYVGELISLLVSLPLTVLGQKKLKTAHPEKSPIAQNLFLGFMRQLSTTVGVKYMFKPYADGSQRKSIGDQEDWLDCSLLSSYLELDDARCPENSTGQPFLSENKSLYNIPLKVRIPDISSQSSTVELEVHAQSISLHVPCWLSSPTRSEPGHLYQQEGPSIGTSFRKSVTLPLRIIHPPQLKFQQKSIAGKHFIVVQIKNTSAYYCVKIDECVILPDSCPKSNKNLACTDCKTQQSHKQLGCSQHANMVKKVSCASEMFDSLSPSECYTLCYILNTTDGIENLPKEDLSLEVYIKWNIPYQQYGDQATIQTSYRIPTMKVIQVPFVMSASMEEFTIRKGESFTVQYSITNKLQDFLSITLNWNPNLSDLKEGKEPARRRYQDGLVCQDPCIELGPCSYGSTLQTKVRFLAVSQGVYEVCKHMKINLRYLIPSSETVSLGSPCSGTSEDLLCVAAEDLWRSRSGSGSSFNESHVWNLPEQDNRFKSYSSGDLCPDVSVTDYDTNVKPRNRFEDKSSTPRLDVPQSSKYEQLLLSPSNFLKTSCQIYVR